MRNQSRERERMKGSKEKSHGPRHVLDSFHSLDPVPPETKSHSFVLFFSPQSAMSIWSPFWLKVS